MARVASCPQCNHELLLPSEADSESWAKCPECRSFFQVKQAASRELLTALLLDSYEQQTVDPETRDVTLPDAFAPSDLETAAAEFPATDNEGTATPDDIETEVAAQQTIENDFAMKTDDLEFDDLLDETSQPEDFEVADATPDDVETEVAEDHPIVDEIATPQAKDLELDDVVDAPTKSDDLEAAAQRIDEWFRSAKTVPDTSLLKTDVEPGSVEEIRNDLVSSSPARTNVTLDMDAEDAKEHAAMADFDLGDADDQTQRTAAWDDTNQMDDLLADGDETNADEFAGADGDDAVDREPPIGREEQPSINLFADSGAPQIDPSKRRRSRRERSFARSLILIVAAGLFGSAAGYYALLWMGNDFLHVAQYLPEAILPAGFTEQKQLVQNAPPPTAPDATADAAATTDKSIEPRELPPATEETAAPISDAIVGTDTAPADSADQSEEVQTSFSEIDPSANANAPSSAVGDRYSTPASETDASASNNSTATGVTTEKPATADLSLDDLAPTEPPATDSTQDAAAAPSLPASIEPAATGITETDTAGNEPATFDAASADPLSDIANTSNATEVVEIKIANAPVFTGDDLRASIGAAAKAQPQLVAGNFADSRAVAQTKSRSYAILADLAQKAMFADASQQPAQATIEQANDLFRQTLTNAHTRGEVAQILPHWVRSPNRKHGGVFFGGLVVSHVPAGSVVECKIELDGGQTLTVLAPPNAVDQVDKAKPQAIVGWIVDAPQTQVSGYSGTAKSPAIWTKKLIPLE
jgi:hypothetical protein